MLHTELRSLAPMGPQMTPNRWERLAFPLFAAGLLCSAAWAADLGAAPQGRLLAYDWSGIHVAIMGGGIFDDHNASFTYENVDPALLPLVPHGANLNSAGGIVGGAVGYDIETGGWVLGLEGDISWTNFGDHDTRVVAAVPAIMLPQINFATSYNMDWFTTVRARIGVPIDRWLIYGTGGLAVADVSLNSTVAVVLLDQRLLGSTDKTKAGWTLGGGAEYALCSNVTFKVEALWFDLGHIALNAGNPNAEASLDVDQKVEGVIARTGIGYKF